MMNAQDKDLLINQLQIDVSLISFMGVFSVFFIGSLLPKFNSYDISVKIPISFLIIATFAFLISALILSNASSKISLEDTKKLDKHLKYGYAISEYLGVFLLILSIPLAVSIITADTYLRIITFSSAILGMVVYQFMGFSLLQSHFSKKYKLISIIVILFGIILFVSQIYAFYFTAISIIFLLFILLITIMAPVKNSQ